MIRKYALVVFNNLDEIIDRYNLDLVTNPTGNGFKLSLDYISSDIEDIITKVTQQKMTKEFNVLQYQNSYAKANSLSAWIQKYSSLGNVMALEYNDTQNILYCEGRVTELGKTERDEYGLLTQKFVFTVTTPNFQKKENTIIIRQSSVGKKYPFKYPYQYGKSVVQNNSICNPYILDIPLIITINGGISAPSISLLDEKGTAYNTVKFSGIVLVTGTKIVINSAQRKIIYIDASGNETDYTPETDPMYDTFLRAKSGNSTISINTTEATTGFELIGSWRQYTL